IHSMDMKKVLNNMSRRLDSRIEKSYDVVIVAVIRPVVKQNYSYGIDSGRHFEVVSRHKYIVI
ncbi:MAG: hypothetical protein WCL71_06890, partial [Deltaproteobacteria bacterium]